MLRASDRDGLLRAGRRVYVVRDAVARVVQKARKPRSGEWTNGAEIVTRDGSLRMLETAEHPRLRDMIALIK